MSENISQKELRVLKCHYTDISRCLIFKVLAPFQTPFVFTALVYDITFSAFMSTLFLTPPSPFTFLTSFGFSSAFFCANYISAPDKTSKIRLSDTLHPPVASFLFPPPFPPSFSIILFKISFAKYF